jgi:hypothetical protein
MPMSEYQYYEWQTVDGLLTPNEQAAVGRLSSHISVSSSRAWVEYHWSEYQARSQRSTAQYFDAHLYSANWGSLQSLVDEIIPLLDSDEYFELL